MDTGAVAAVEVEVYTNVKALSGDLVEYVVSEEVFPPENKLRPSKRLDRSSKGSVPEVSDLGCGIGSSPSI